MLSWTPEQLDYIHDAAYWSKIVNACEGADVIEVSEMGSNEEVWDDWLIQDALMLDMDGDGAVKVAFPIIADISGDNICQLQD